MKIGGGGDYNSMELPDGVADSMICMTCKGPMSHMGKGIYFCISCRVMGTEMSPVSRGELKFTVVPEGAVEEASALTKDRIYKIDPEQIKPAEVMIHWPKEEVAPISPLHGYMNAQAKSKLPVPFPESERDDQKECEPSEHHWSDPVTVDTTVRRTTVTCDRCGKTLSTTVDSSPEAAIADLLQQIGGTTQ